MFSILSRSHQSSDLTRRIVGGIRFGSRKAFVAEGIGPIRFGDKGSPTVIKLFLLPGRDALHFGHDAEQVAAPEFLDLLLRVAAADEL